MNLKPNRMGIYRHAGMVPKIAQKKNCRADIERLSLPWSIGPGLNLLLQKGGSPLEANHRFRECSYPEIDDNTVQYERESQNNEK